MPTDFVPTPTIPTVERARLELWWRSRWLSDTATSLLSLVGSIEERETHASVLDAALKTESAARMLEKLCAGPAGEAWRAIHGEYERRED